MADALTGKEIIEMILEYIGMKASSFAKKLGYERPQRIYDIQKGKTRSISTDVADDIIKVFPLFNKVWLLTGVGEMLNSAQQFPNTYVNGMSANYQGNFSQPIHTEISNTKDVKDSGRKINIENEYNRLREENARLLIQLEFKDKLIEEKDKIIEEKGRFIEMILTKS